MRLFGRNGRQPCFSHVCIIFNRRLLNQAVFGSHKEETALFKLIDRYHCCDLFLRLKLEQIDWEDVIRNTVPPKFLDLNLRDYRAGLEAAQNQSN